MLNAINRLAAVALLGTVLVVAVPASAQDVGVTGEIVGTQTTSPQEKIQYAIDATAEMRDAVKSVVKLLEGARRESSVERLQCLSYRLTALRALVQVSEAADTAMKESLAAGATERADHEFRKIAVALSKTRQLLAEAERCLDDSGMRSGESVTEYTGGITDDGDDTEGVGFDAMDLQEDPPHASPFQ